MPVWQSKTEAVSVPAEATKTHQVYYSATVYDGSGDNPTRATLNDENKYVFSSSDRLYVCSIDDDVDKVYGALTLKEGDAGKSSGVTFEGTLTVPDGFENEEGYAETRLRATLVGFSDAIHITNGEDTKIDYISWPQDGTLVNTMAKAVEKFSDMTAESTYGEQAFQFNQGTCFVNFSVTLDDGTPANTSIGAYVWTRADGADSENIIRSGTVKTVQDGEVVKANFVTAFPGGTVINGAVVGLGERNVINFGGTESKTLEANKVYNVNRTFTRKEATISYAKTAVVKSNPDQAFINDLTNTGQGTEIVTYESSDPTVATVDENGEVTVLKAGTTRITATVQDGVNFSYNEHDAYYDLTVYDPVPLDVNEPTHVTSDHIGWIIGTDGLAYVTRTGVSAAQKIPVAMIGYVGDPGTADASSTGADGYRGLAIALSDAATGARWCNTVTKACTSHPCEEYTEVFAELTGIENTTRLVSAACGTGHSHPVIDGIGGYIIPSFTPSVVGCSDWFLPSSGQWFKVFEGCGVATSQWHSLSFCPDSEGKMPTDADNHCADNYTVMQNLMMAAAGEDFAFGERYWTSTELVANNPSQARYAFYVAFDSNQGVNINPYPKIATCDVRLFIAF